MSGNDYSDPDALREAIDRFKSDMMRIRQAEQKAHNDELQPFRDKEERARKYMEDTGAIQASVNVWDAIQHYGAWSKNEEFEQHCLPEVTFISAEPVDYNSDDRSESVTINYDGMELQFTHSNGRSSLPDGTFETKMNLAIDGEEVFGFRSLDDSNGYVSPTVLKPGPWLITLVKLSEIVRLENERKMRRLTAEIQANAVKDLDI